MSPESGKVTGNLTCDSLALGTAGAPYGVRTLGDLLFVAVANDPMDGENQFVHIVDISGLKKTGLCKSVLQSFSFETDVCHTPHLLGVDHERDEVYLACVASNKSNVLRLTPVKDEILI